MNSEHIIAMIGIAATILGVLLSYFNIRVAKKIALTSGWLKMPRLLVRYGGLVIGNNFVQEVVYGVTSEIKKVQIGVLRVVIENNGARAAENIKLEIVVPYGANRGGSEHLKGELKGIMPGFSRQCFRINNLLHIYHHLPALNPRENMSVDEPFWIEKTVDLQGEIPFHDVGGEQIQLKYQVTLGLEFNIFLFSKEDIPIASKVILFIMDASNVTQLAKRWIQVQLEIEGPCPRGINLRRKVRWLQKRLSSKQVLLVIPSLEEWKLSRKKSGSTSALVESFDKSQRWLLVRSWGRWKILPCEWRFTRI